MKAKQDFFRIWLPPLFWSAFIFFLSSLSINLQPKLNLIFIDKVAHFLIYLPLGFLVARAFYLSEVKSLRKYLVILTLGFCLLYAASDEIHQLFVYNREASAADALFDIFGSAIGLFIFYFSKKG